jgi:hypothetical protein
MTVDELGSANRGLSPVVLLLLLLLLLIGSTNTCPPRNPCNKNELKFLKT